MNLKTLAECSTLDQPRKETGERTNGAGGTARVELMILGGYVSLPVSRKKLLI